MLKRLVEYFRATAANRRIIKIEREWSIFTKNLPRSTNGQTMLHIGCGDINSPEFINIDARPQAHVHIVTTSLFRLEMIPGNVADLIYMSHVLEHVSHRKIIETLREMRRILKPKGVLRISVPDFDRIIEIYEATNREIRAIEPPLMGAQDYPFNYHYSVFNETRLHEAMLASGFSETRPWDPLACTNHDFEDWASRYISWNGHEFPISLNIEAIK